MTKLVQDHREVRVARGCRFRAITASGVLTASLALSTTASAAEKFVYGLSWLPEAEHCGFFQAKAHGLYDAVGLDVELYPGAPGLNMPQLVAAGRVDAAMGSALTTLNMRANNIDGVTIAAFFQKSPQTLVAHPDPALQKLEDLKTRKIAVANFARATFWVWLKAAYGFDDSQLRPYAYSPSAFVADKLMVQQGYITEDEFFLGRAIGGTPKSFLLADHGYPDYATTVFTMASVIERRRDVLNRFMDASTKGWMECMYGDPQPAYQLLRAMDPEQSFELSAFKISQMTKHGFIDGGDAATLGMGAMTHERWKAVFDVMSAGGVYAKDLDYKKAYSLEFVNKKSGR
jgi:NitT/TauT family transport system substrate-binding protein